MWGYTSHVKHPPPHTYTYTYTYTHTHTLLGACGSLSVINYYRRPTMGLLADSRKTLSSSLTLVTTTVEGANTTISSAVEALSWQAKRMAETSKLSFEVTELKIQQERAKLVLEKESYKYEIAADFCIKQEELKKTLARKGITDEDVKAVLDRMDALNSKKK